MKEEVGRRLLESRKSCNMTQLEVAKSIGVAQPVYQRFEKGMYECSYEQLVKLCDLFDISCDYLLGRKEW